MNDNNNCGGGRGESNYRGIAPVTAVQNFDDHHSGSVYQDTRKS